MTFEDKFLPLEESVWGHDVINRRAFFHSKRQALRAVESHRRQGWIIRSCFPDRDLGECGAKGSWYFIASRPATDAEIASNFPTGRPQAKPEDAKDKSRRIFRETTARVMGRSVNKPRKDPP